MKGSTVAAAMRSTYVSFPAALRRVRQERELTQADVADLFEVSFVEVSRWETGSRVPRPEMLCCLLDWIGDDRLW